MNKIKGTICYTSDNAVAFIITDSCLNKATQKFGYKKVNQGGEILEEYPEQDTLKLANVERAKLIANLIPNTPAVRKKRERKAVVNDSNTGLSKIEKLDIFNIISEEILNGRPKSEIFETIKEKHPSLEFNEIETIYRGAIDFFRKRVIEQFDLPTVVHIHTGIYEKIYQYFDSIGYTVGKSKALFGKERLLGFHKDESIFEVNQENNTVIEKAVEYDLGKLSSDEGQRLTKYLEKVKVSND